MFFSPGVAYVLKVMVNFHEEDSYLHAKDLALAHGVPSQYLSKLFQSLSHAGILESCRGPRGGFRLAKPAHHITVKEIVEAIQGPSLAEGCVLGLGLCHEGNPCSLHHIWVDIRPQVDSALEGTTLRDLQLQGRFPTSKAAGEIQPLP